MKWAAWRRTAPTRETRCSAATALHRPRAACNAQACHDQCSTDNADGSNDMRAATSCAGTRRKRKGSASAYAQTRKTERAPCDARDAREHATLRRTPGRTLGGSSAETRAAPCRRPSALRRPSNARVLAPLHSATHACAIASEPVHCPSHPRICFQMRALSGPRHICAGTGGRGFRACTGDQPLLADREDGHALRNVRGRAHAAARRREVEEFDRRRCEQ